METTKTINLDECSIQIMSLVLRDGGIMRGLITEIIDRTSGFVIVENVDGFGDMIKRRKSTYIKPTPFDVIPVSKTTKLIFLRGIVTKKIQLDDLEKILRELSMDLVYRIHTVEFIDSIIENRKKRESLQEAYKLKQAEKSKAHSTSVETDNPHDTYRAVPKNDT